MVGSEVGTHIGHLGNSLLQEFGSECSRDLGHKCCQHHYLCNFKVGLKRQRKKKGFLPPPNPKHRKTVIWKWHWEQVGSRLSSEPLSLSLSHTYTHSHAHTLSLSFFIEQCESRSFLMNLYPYSARRKNTLFIVKKYFNFFQLLTLIFTFYIKVENKYEILKGTQPHIMHLFPPVLIY